MLEATREDRIAALLLRFVGNPAGRGQIAAEFLRLTAIAAKNEGLMEAQDRAIQSLTSQLAEARKALMPFAGKAAFFSGYPPSQLVDIGTTVGALMNVSAAIDAARQEKP